jgi:hypothetical protein
MFLGTSFCGERQHGGRGACREGVPVCHDDAAAGRAGLALCRWRKIGLISGGSLEGFIQLARHSIAIHQSASQIAKCSLCLTVVLILACRSHVHLSDFKKYASTTIGVLAALMVLDLLLERENSARSITTERRYMRLVAKWDSRE